MHNACCCVCALAYACCCVRLVFVRERETIQGAQTSMRSQEVSASLSSCEYDRSSPPTPVLRLVQVWFSLGRMHALSWLRPQDVLGWPAHTPAPFSALACGATADPTRTRAWRARQAGRHAAMTVRRRVGVAGKAFGRGLTRSEEEWGRGGEGGEGNLQPGRRVALHTYARTHRGQPGRRVALAVALFAVVSRGIGDVEQRAVLCRVCVCVRERESSVRSRGGPLARCICDSQRAPARVPGLVHSSVPAGPGAPCVQGPREQASGRIPSS